ncbi:MAG: sigma-54-dependent Fis family transcriptional regulator [Candidatus Hydrogenedentes bacterium]|nr:sigma-54-dependent Fis family transcriptional regulator [Candidatus Hydrogenedentota bacterium]
MTQSREKPFVLIVEDDSNFAGAVSSLLAADYELSRAATGDEAREAMQRYPDVVLLDIVLPWGMAGQLSRPIGLQLLDEFLAADPDVAVVMITAEMDEVETAVEAMRRGAHNYLVKGRLGGDQIKAAVESALRFRRKALAQNRLQRHEQDDRREQVSRYSLVGESRAIQAIREQIRNLHENPTNPPASVMITGETGVGKENVAGWLHFSGPRSRRPMVVVLQGALNDPDMLYSEYFGHEPRAFTGADTRHIGYFEQAHESTLALDEIGDLQRELQGQLLRAVDKRLIRRLKSAREIPVDVQIVSMTNRDMEAEVRKGAFREDLYFRLNQVRIHVPPLRERREDIPLLVSHFLGHLAANHPGGPAFGQEAISELQEYAWPGNVRQLGDFVRNCGAFANGEIVTREHVRAALALLPAYSARAGLPPRTTEAPAPAISEAAPAPDIQQAAEYLRSEGNLELVGRTLGISHPTLYKRIDLICDLILKRLVENRGNISTLAQQFGVSERQAKAAIRKRGRLLKRARELLNQRGHGASALAPALETEESNPQMVLRILEALSSDTTPL